MNVGKLKVRQIVKAQFMPQLADMYADHTACVLHVFGIVQRQVKFFVVLSLFTKSISSLNSVAVSGINSPSSMA